MCDLFVKKMEKVNKSQGDLGPKLKSSASEGVKPLLDPTRYGHFTEACASIAD